MIHLRVPASVLGALVCLACASCAPQRPARACIFIVDGLSYKAIDKLDLPNLESLIRKGVHYKECYHPLPAPPSTWKDFYHTCSIGNIALVTGTIFWKQGQEQLQQVFSQTGPTAHVANCSTYKSIDVGYTASFVGGGPDEKVIERAIEFVAEHRPVFMRIHLQNAGYAGYRVHRSKGRWKNIWEKGSPYRMKTVNADRMSAKSA